MRNPGDHDTLDRARRRMVEKDLQGRDIADPGVLRVMAEIPREEFVPEAYRGQAYSDCPLPIGAAQTISQPYIVALMTQLLRLSPDGDVLEVGTGSGYQTAVLARLARGVYTIERLADLATSARDLLKRLGIDNVAFRTGDGSCGWPEQRTFERIMVTAAVPELPAPLLAQLAEGGRIVAPVGFGSTQHLVLGEKRRAKLIESYICGCRFVKLIGTFGFDG